MRSAVFWYAFRAWRVFVLRVVDGVGRFFSLCRVVPGFGAVGASASMSFSGVSGVRVYSLAVGLPPPIPRRHSSPVGRVLSSSARGGGRLAGASGVVGGVSLLAAGARVPRVGGVRVAGGWRRLWRWRG